MNDRLAFFSYVVIFSIWIRARSWDYDCRPLADHCAHNLCPSSFLCVSMQIFQMAHSKESGGTSEALLEGPSQ